MSNDKIGKIINVGDLLKTKGLEIPVYQRPYRWTEESARRLYKDVADAMEKRQKEHIEDFSYRLGTVILHEEKGKESTTYNIVDGQQRITTLILLLKCLGHEVPAIKKLRYPALSRDAILRNYRLFKQIVKDDEKENYKDFLLENCEVLKLVVKTEAEAFQLFDSQNSRGKGLDPHDLLKAYHLREMGDVPRERTVALVREWEAIQRDGEVEIYQNKNRLHEFFNFNLHPLVNWYRGRHGLDFNKFKIGEFKGIRKKDRFNFSRYHLSAYSFADEMNARLKYIQEGYKIFQLTQPVVAGEKFFEFVFHYWQLRKEIEARMDKYNTKAKIALGERTGDRYIQFLLKNALMFYADRFDVESITEPVYKKIFAWCYFLRLSMNSVYQTSVNKYALGEHDIDKDKINLFAAIDEMTDPDGILGITVCRPEKKEKEDQSGQNGNNDESYKEIKEYCGWREE